MLFWMGTKSLSENYTALRLEEHLTFLPAISLSLHGELSIPRGLYIVVVMKSRSSSKRKSTTGTTTIPLLQKGRGESSHGTTRPSTAPSSIPFQSKDLSQDSWLVLSLVHALSLSFGAASVFFLFLNARVSAANAPFSLSRQRGLLFSFVMAMLQLQENILRRILRSHLVPTC